MLYMLIIHDNQAEIGALTPEKLEPIMQRHQELMESLQKAGKYRGCMGLTPASSARTLRTENGRTFVTDGPYAEAREQVGGYYLVDAKDLDDALAIARRIPTTDPGGIEVRPVGAEGDQP